MQQKTTKHTNIEDSLQLVWKKNQRKNIHN